MSSDSKFKAFSKKFQEWIPKKSQKESNQEEIALEHMDRYDREQQQQHSDVMPAKMTLGPSLSNGFRREKYDSLFENPSLSRASSFKRSQLDLDESTLSDKELKSIMRKIDFHLVPVVMFVFFYTILDTTALVHAKVAGLTKSLHMSDGQYHVALVIYPITHMLFSIPAMWFLNKYGSKRWISILVLLGGIFMLCTGFVQKPHEMIILRTILGILNAGLLPACIQTITLLYPRHYVQWRVALAVTGGTIGGLVGSFIAFGLTDIHSNHFEGWRIIFVIEGIITIIAAPITYLVMPDSIKECSYLSPLQKTQYQQIRGKNASETNSKLSTKRKVGLFLSGLADVKTCLAFLIIIGIYIPFQGLLSNLPVMMVEGFGFKSKQAQILPIPIKIMAAVLILIVSWSSDRIEKRILFVVGPAILGSIGFLALLATRNGHTRYGMVFLAEMVHVALPSTTTILTQNIVCDTKRSAALGGQYFLGGVASIVGAYLIWSKDAPRYIAAYLVMALFCLLALISSLFLFLYLRRENRFKRQQVDSGVFDKKSDQELRAMGDKNPFFIYRY